MRGKGQCREIGLHHQRGKHQAIDREPAKRATATSLLRGVEFPHDAAAVSQCRIKGRTARKTNQHDREQGNDASAEEQGASRTTRRMCAASPSFRSVHTSCASVGGWPGPMTSAMSTTVRP